MDNIARDVAVGVGVHVEAAVSISVDVGIGVEEGCFVEVAAGISVDVGTGVEEGCFGVSVGIGVDDTGIGVVAGCGVEVAGIGVCVNTGVEDTEADVEVGSRGVKEARSNVDVGNSVDVNNDDAVAVAKVSVNITGVRGSNGFLASFNKSHPISRISVINPPIIIQRYRDCANSDSWSMRPQ